MFFEGSPTAFETMAQQAIKPITWYRLTPVRVAIPPHPLVVKWVNKQPVTARFTARMIWRDLNKKDPEISDSFVRHHVTRMKNLEMIVKNEPLRGERNPTYSRVKR